MRQTFPVLYRPPQQHRLARHSALLGCSDSWVTDSQRVEGTRHPHIQRSIPRFGTSQETCILKHQRCENLRSRSVPRSESPALNGVMNSKHVHKTQKKIENVTAVSIRIQVSWDMTSYRFVYSYWHVSVLSSSGSASSWMKSFTFNPWIRNVGNQWSGEQLACTRRSLVSGPRYESRTSIIWSMNAKHYNSSFDSTLFENSYCIEATTQSRFSFWLQHCITYPSTFISCDHIQFTTTTLSIPVLCLSTR
jgi:hypothetical protein